MENRSQEHRRCQRNDISTNQLHTHTHTHRCTYIYTRNPSLYCCLSQKKKKSIIIVHCRTFQRYTILLKVNCQKRFSESIWVTSIFFYAVAEYTQTNKQIKEYIKDNTSLSEVREMRFFSTDDAKIIW